MEVGGHNDDDDHDDHGYKGSPPVKKCFLSGIARKGGGETPARIF